MKYEYRNSGIEWIEKIPNHWKIDRLKDIAEINYAVLSTNTPSDYLLKYIDISNVNVKGIVSLDNIEEMEFEMAPSRARRIIKFGDIIISSVRPNLQAIAYIELNDDNLICSTGFNVIKTEDKIVLSKYLYYYLLSEYSKNYFESRAKGVGYPAVADKDFNTLKVFIPPISEQTQIIKYLDRVCEDIEKVIQIKIGNSKIEDETTNNQINVLLSYKKALIQEVITGKKQVYGLTKEKQQMQTT